MKQLRNTFFCTLFAVSLLFTAAAFANDDHGHAPVVPPQDALKRLAEGNARFVAGKAEHPNGKTDRAKETADHGQRPFATILTCSDSRVPLEVVFDQGIGDIFTIKVAGNVSGAAQLGSIEYGVAHTGTALVVVLGHSKCGAVTAACTDGGHEGSIESLMQAIAPAVARIKATAGKTGKEAVEQVCLANVYYQIEQILAGSEILRSAVKAGKAQIVGGVYDIETGKVEFYGQHPKNADLVDGSVNDSKVAQPATPAVPVPTPAAPPQPVPPQEIPAIELVPATPQGTIPVVEPPPAPRQPAPQSEPVVEPPAMPSAPPVFVPPAVEPQPVPPAPQMEPTPQPTPAVDVVPVTPPAPVSPTPEPPTPVAPTPEKDERKDDVKDVQKDVKEDVTNEVKPAVKNEKKPAEKKAEKPAEQTEKRTEEKAAEKPEVKVKTKPVSSRSAGPAARPGSFRDFMLHKGTFMGR